jgi:hypothetical protein
VVGRVLGGGRGGELIQALYAHMNNKIRKKVMDFCMLILYPSGVPNLFFPFNIFFLVQYLEFSLNNTMLSLYGGLLTSFST